MDRKPYLEVNDADGTNQVPIWGSRLIGVRIIDRGGYESDEATFMFTNKPPYRPAPAEGTPYTVKVGWSADNIAISGYYTLQRIHLLGNPKSGEQVHYICRAGDLSDQLNQVDSQHFGPDNGNNTMGDVFKNLFASTGKSVEVAPEIAGMDIPNNYLLRWGQNSMDFATDIADHIGAVVKPMGDKIIVMQRNVGQSASGAALSTILIRRDPSYEYDVEVEPRFQYQSVSSPWFDKDAGRLKSESQSQGTSGGKDGLPHPAASQDDAKTLAKSVAQEWGRFTGTGMFVVVGDPSAVAEAPVSCFGFPDPIDTIKWQSSSVTHDIIPNTGWTTTIETETQPDQ